MYSSLLTSLTANQLTTTLLCFIVAWSVWKTLCHLSPAEGMEEKTSKVMDIPVTQTAHIGLVTAVLAILFFLPGIWPVSIIVTLYSLFQNYRLNNKLNRLSDEINALHQSESILSLNFGNIDGSPDSVPLKIWFKRGKESWPLVELETGTHYTTIPIERTPDQIFREHFLPRISNALKDEGIEAMLCDMKNDLLAHGVTHPIDIKGWNHHPIIQEMLERIMNANPPQKIHPEEPFVRAA